MNKVDKLLFGGLAVYVLASFLFLSFKVQTSRGESELFGFMDHVEGAAQELGPIVIQFYCFEGHAIKSPSSSYLHSCELGELGLHIKQYHNVLALNLGVPARDVVMY